MRWRKSSRRAVSNRSASRGGRLARSRPTHASSPRSSRGAPSRLRKRCASTFGWWRTFPCSGGSRNPLTMSTPAPSIPDGGAAVAAQTCPRCDSALNKLLVCPECGYHAPLTAAQRIDQLTDRGTFQESDRHLWSGNPIHFSDGVTTYDKQLAQAQAATRLLDAVVTGRARVMGIDVVLVIFDFRFL